MKLANKMLLLAMASFAVGGLTSCNADGNTIKMGLYPQTRVSVVDNSEVKFLSDSITKLPEVDDELDWNQFLDTIGRTADTGTPRYLHNLWYKDFTGPSGTKYRAVCLVTKVYWYRFEPITWKILKEDKENNKRLLMATKSIDQMRYSIDSLAYEVLYEDDNIVSYKNSLVRAFLNDAVYNLAFNEEEKASILTTTVDNSVESLKIANEGLACADTEDKLFLPSYKELVDETLFKSAKDRIRCTTDYAVEFPHEGGKACYYLTRSPVQEELDNDYINLVTNKGELISLDAAHGRLNFVPCMYVSMASN